MKAYLSVTKQFFAQIWSDAMLTVLFFVPVFMGCAFRFGVPALEKYLCGCFQMEKILTPYYSVFDLLLIIMTPVMFTAAGAMVILDEADMGLSRAISVTPVGRKGYIMSRVYVPSFIATIYCFLAICIFHLSSIGVCKMLLLSLCAGVFGVMVALMISSLAKNKVEGIAMSKMSGLFVLGLPISILIPAPAKYLAFFLPTLWMTDYTQGGSTLNIVPTLLTAVLWCFLFYKHFCKKIL